MRTGPARVVSMWQRQHQEGHTHSCNSMLGCHHLVGATDYRTGLSLNKTFMDPESCILTTVPHFCNHLIVGEPSPALVLCPSCFHWKFQCAFASLWDSGISTSDLSARHCMTEHKSTPSCNCPFRHGWPRVPAGVQTTEIHPAVPRPARAFWARPWFPHCFRHGARGAPRAESGRGGDSVQACARSEWPGIAYSGCIQCAQECGAVIDGSYTLPPVIHCASAALSGVHL